MAAIAREVLQKLNGSEAQYASWFEDGNYHCTVQTIIGTTEPDTSGKLEEATGHLADTKLDAEEGAAIALMSLLKETYRFEVDDMNFIERSRSEDHKEQPEKDICIATYMHRKQIEKGEKLSKGWSQLLDDMNFVQEVCVEACLPLFLQNT